MSDDKHTTMMGSILYLNKSESGFSHISIRFVLIISTICIFSSGIITIWQDLLVSMLKLKVPWRTSH